MKPAPVSDKKGLVIGTVLIMSCQFCQKARVEETINKKAELLFQLQSDIQETAVMLYLKFHHNCGKMDAWASKTIKSGKLTTS